MTDVGKNGSLTVSRAGGQVATTLPARYVAESVDLGYAMTVHPCAGRHRGPRPRRGRGQHGPPRAVRGVVPRPGNNDAYVPVEQHLGVDVDRAPDGRTEPETALRAVIARDNGDISATQAMRDELAAAERLDRLSGTYSFAVNQLTPQVDTAPPCAPPSPSSRSSRC